MQNLEFKGTQGEWKAVLPNQSVDFIANPHVMLGDDKVQLNYNGDTSVEERNLNAQLIATAPELLEVCIDILENFQVNQIARERLIEVINKAIK